VKLTMDSKQLRTAMTLFVVMVLMVALMAASALPAFAAPKAGAGCKGLSNAIAKQTEKRPGGPNPVLVQKATERGCITSTLPPS
jgi:hypothetical protein